MGPGSFDAGARDPWVHIRLTDSGNSVISMNLNHNIVLRRTGRTYVILRIQQDVAVNAGDFQSLRPLIDLSWMVCGRLFVRVVLSISAPAIPVILQRPLLLCPLVQASDSRFPTGNARTRPCQGLQRVPTRGLLPRTGSAWQEPCPAFHESEAAKDRAEAPCEGVGQLVPDCAEEAGNRPTSNALDHSEGRSPASAGSTRKLPRISSACSKHFRDSSKDSCYLVPDPGQLDIPWLPLHSALFQNRHHP